jgi:serine/threonine protein phosphatase PrpC
MESSLQLRFAAHTDTGRVRAANEDFHGHAEYPWGQVFVVCDGMGGHVGGATASHIAVSSILEYMARDTARDPAASLEKAISFANEQIYARALNQPELRGMGTTCVMLLQKDSGIWLAHVGDSRAYIYTDGKLHKLSRDHSFVQRLVDQGAIEEEDAESHPRKNELTRALGIRGDVDVEVAAAPIFPKQGDLFVLCSDGLYGMTGDSGIQKVLAGKESLEDKAALLIEAANAAGGHDNITVHLIQVTASPHAANRYVAIKPPVHLGKTLPLEQVVDESPTRPEENPSFFKRNMIPLVFGGVFLLAVAIVGVGWVRNSAKAAKEARNEFVTDSLKRAADVADSLATVRADSLQVDSLRKAFVADSLHQDSVKRKLKPKPKGK